MQKVCVFCGGKPYSKSHEHVLPMWLIEMTGDPKREFNLWVDFEKGQRRIFPAKELSFPACLKCNTSYSEFEAKAKDIVSSILENKPLGQHELNHLLDWLDKVRVGLWLGFRYLDKNLHGIEPNFYISNRIGIWDRYLQFYSLPYARKGLTFHGVHSPVFAHMPSCFGLRINNLYFLNASAPFLFSRRVGFPFFENVYSDKNGAMHGESKIGQDRVMCPVIRRKFIQSAISIYQPISPLIEEERLLTPYLRAHLLPWDSKRGNLLIRNGTVTDWLSEGAKLILIDDNRRENLRIFTYRLAAQVFSYQHELLLLNPMHFETEAERNAHSYKLKMLKRVQNIFIRKCHQGISEAKNKYD